MQKILLLLLSILIELSLTYNSHATGSISSGGQLYPQITFQGHAAQELANLDESLDMIDCYNVRVEANQLVFECVLDANLRQVVSSEQFVIDGLAARELYFKLTRDNDNAGVKCYIAHLVNQLPQIECLISGYLIKN